MAGQRSLYSILNVSSDAEPVVIEAAYRALMKKYHPDQGAGAGRGPAAAEINAAFATLREPERRAEYDRREWNRQQEILLAQYTPPATIVRRRTGFFGWAGWTVAALLGGFLLLSGRPGDDAGLIAGVQVRTAAAAFDEPTASADEAPADEILLTPAAAAQIDAEAKVIAEHAEMTARRLQAAPAASRPAAARAKPRPSQGPARRAPPADEREFLEREGFIY